MKTIILPGFSLKYKDWAYKVKEKLDLLHEIVVHQWKHWKTGNNEDFLAIYEAKKAFKEFLR